MYFITNKMEKQNPGLILAGEGEERVKEEKGKLSVFFLELHAQTKLLN